MSAQKRCMFPQMGFQQRLWVSSRYPTPTHIRVCEVRSPYLGSGPSLFVIQMTLRETAFTIILHPKIHPFMGWQNRRPVHYTGSRSSVYRITFRRHECCACAAQDRLRIHSENTKVLIRPSQVYHYAHDATIHAVIHSWEYATLLMFICYTYG